MHAQDFKTPLSLNRPVALLLFEVTACTAELAGIFKIMGNMVSSANPVTEQLIAYNEN